MSIATRTGDQGTTALMYGKRVSKTHPRVLAYGCVDELNAALGLVKINERDPQYRAFWNEIQGALIRLSGTLAVDDSDQERYLKNGRILTVADLQLLDEHLERIESQLPPFKQFVHPGASLYSAHAHCARTTCRRAERAVVALIEMGSSVPAPILQYLNRLSDFLWLMARMDEIHIEQASTQQQ
jgi:cob(I)alamin adenosyltransferase